MNFLSKKLNVLLCLCLVMAFFSDLGCTQKKESPSVAHPNADPLALLMDGNDRFTEDHPIHPDQTLDRLRELEKGQHPFAVIVSCSDSRVPPELLFDQGFGDLFVIRNAGNIVDVYEIASVEYAVEHLHTPLVIVLGHSQCGAIGAFIEHKHDSIPNHIQKIIDYIKSEPEEAEISESTTDYYEKAIEANVLHGVHTLSSTGPVLSELAQKGEVKILGAVYDIETGKVEVLQE